MEIRDNSGGNPEEIRTNVSSLCKSVPFEKSPSDRLRSSSSRNSMATSIRNKDWVFNALYNALGPGVYGNTDCVLNIPLTFLFKDGQPAKGLMTNPQNGRLKRVNLDQMQLSRFDYSTGFRGPGLHSLRAMRKVLDDFSVQTEYFKHQNDPQDPFIATVRVFLLFFILIF
jgi:hypothetical protein